MNQQPRSSVESSFFCSSTCSWITRLHPSPTFPEINSFTITVQMGLVPKWFHSSSGPWWIQCVNEKYFPSQDATKTIINCTVPTTLLYMQPLHRVARPPRHADLLIDRSIDRGRRRRQNKKCYRSVLNSQLPMQPNELSLFISSTLLAGTTGDSTTPTRSGWMRTTTTTTTSGAS